MPSVYPSTIDRPRRNRVIFQSRASKLSTAFPTRAASMALMLTYDPMRVFQHGLDLLPYGLIQLIATDCSIAARCITVIPVRIRTGYPIVAVVGVFRWPPTFPRAILP